MERKRGRARVSALALFVLLSACSLVSPKYVIKERVLAWTEIVECGLRLDAAKAYPTGVIDKLIKADNSFSATMKRARTPDTDGYVAGMTNSESLKVDGLIDAYEALNDKANADHILEGGEHIC